MYIAMIESRVAGVPCLIGLLSYECSPGTESRTADSDWDYHGWTDIDFDVLDRKGRKAPWLERKLTDRDLDRIYQDVTKPHYGWGST